MIKRLGPGVILDSVISAEAKDRDGCNRERHRKVGGKERWLSHPCVMKCRDFFFYELRCSSRKGEGDARCCREL